MEVLATFGKMSKELFEYNRDIFKFDQMQRLQRDILRLDMQVKRFELFREDIRDLVELTVGKMEMYHLVGALFLEFCIAFYVEGKIETLTVPCFSIALYYLSVAGAFLYLILAVWLSMFASISSHSFGVRLLCRYVRLPIPGASQLGAMTSKLADYEKEQRGMFRMPFVQQAQNWTDSKNRGEAPTHGGSAGSDAITAVASTIGRQASTMSMKASGDYLGPGIMPFHGGEEGVLRAAPGGFAGEHVTLFRRLQAKWQCYDAYARVSMSLGANQILLSVTYYLINVTLVEYRSPTACYSLIVVYQIAALALAFLDIAGMHRWSVVLVQAVGTIPCVIAAYTLTWPGGLEFSQTEWNGFDPLKHKYPFAPLCFFCMVVWLECLLWVAWPSEDEASLPRRFRTVLFLDVFGDLHYDPTDAENETSEGPADATQGLVTRTRDVGPRPSFRSVSEADDACELAHQALRRWESLPDAFDIGPQRAELQRLREELTVWRSALQDEVREHARRSEIHWADDMLQDDTRTLAELSQEDLEDDHFRDRIVGPVEVVDQKSGQNSTYYWEPVQRRMIRKPGEAKVLTLQEAAGCLVDAETKVRVVVNPRRAAQLGSSSARSAGSASDDSPAAQDFGMRTMFSNFRRSETQRNPFVPQRLPWKVLKLSTRALQVAWFWQGAVYALEELGYYKMDFMRDTGEHTDMSGSTEARDKRTKEASLPSDEGDARRLARREAGTPFEAIAVSWPWSEPADRSSSSVAADSVEEVSLGKNAAQSSWRAFLWPESVMSCVPGAGVLVGARSRSHGRSLSVRNGRGGDMALFWAAIMRQPPRAALDFNGTRLSFGRLELGLSRDDANVDGSTAPTAAAGGEGSRASSSSQAPWVALCGPPGGEARGAAAIQGCLFARPRERAIEFERPAPSGEPARRLLRVEDGFGGATWQLLAGCQVPCAAVGDMLVATAVEGEDHGGRGEASWCILLAGWDGASRSLAVAAARLAGGPGSLPLAREAIVPVFELPFGAGLQGVGAQDVFVGASKSGMPSRPPLARLVSLSLEAASGRGRLHALLADGTVEAWELLPTPTALGRQRLAGPWLPRGGASLGRFALRPAGLCELEVHEAENATHSSTRMVMLAFSTDAGPRILVEADARVQKELRT
eukprot:TRINITY_DN14265_c0_g4_i2.p1 TRINITY_DN14265_c0_g4~~TRINITY_DN14265_c0_g4_i2.p1  ORF type:complete len:1144 (+),score=205.73 TRINITY_DN14265_c0_g4_i2:87-3518(+)